MAFILKEKMFEGVNASLITYAPNGPGMFDLTLTNPCFLTPLSFVARVIYFALVLAGAPRVAVEPFWLFFFSFGVLPSLNHIRLLCFDFGCASDPN